jgi:hypothetical protein
LIIKRLGVLLRTAWQRSGILGLKSGRGANNEMRITNTIMVCLLIAMVGGSCRMIDTLTSNNKAGTVDALWPDVPPIPGATKTDLALPLAARMMIRAAMQGKVSFIAFTTEKSAQEVQDFYTKERMKSAGWVASDRGCISDREDKKSQGAVCLYNRQNGKKKEGLAIVLAQDEKSKQTDIFYARIDLTESEASPSP